MNSSMHIVYLLRHANNFFYKEASWRLKYNLKLLILKNISDVSNYRYLDPGLHLRKELIINLGKHKNQMYHQ